MYKDEMWYRNWSRAVETHKEDLTDKQLKDKWTKENFKCRLISKARKQGNTLVTDY